MCKIMVYIRGDPVPFLDASLTSYAKLELLVVDLSGPMSVETWTGKAYAFIAIEMNS